MTGFAALVRATRQRPPRSYEAPVRSRGPLASQPQAPHEQQPLSRLLARSFGVHSLEGELLAVEVPLAAVPINPSALVFVALEDAGGLARNADLVEQVPGLASDAVNESAAVVDGLLSGHRSLLCCRGLHVTYIDRQEAPCQVL